MSQRELIESIYLFKKEENQPLEGIKKRWEMLPAKRRQYYLDKVRSKNDNRSFSPVDEGKYNTELDSIKLKMDALSMKYDEGLLLETYTQISKLSSEIDGVRGYEKVLSELNSVTSQLAVYISNNLKRIVRNIYGIRLLGEGSFGVVYDAFELLGNSVRRVALKEIKLSSAAETENEAENMFKLERQCNKHFVCIYDFFTENNKQYIVMEFLDGYIPLDEYIETLSPVTPQSSQELKQKYATIINNMCEGLKLMHDLKIAHNDIKPANMMVNVDTLNVKYIDFGGGCFYGECKLNAFTYLFVDPVLYNKASKDRTFKKYGNGDERFNQFQQGDIFSLGLTIYDLIMRTTPLQDLIYDYNNNENLATLEYFKNYDYNLNDPNKDYIEDVLRSLPLCKITLASMLDMQKDAKGDTHREYTCSC